MRVNALDTGLLLDDLAALVRAQPFGIMLPECSSGRDVALLDCYLSALEATDGMPPGRVRCASCRSSRRAQRPCSTCPAALRPGLACGR